MVLINSKNTFQKVIKIPVNKHNSFDASILADRKMAAKMADSQALSCQALSQPYGLKMYTIIPCFRPALHDFTF